MNDHLLGGAYSLEQRAQFMLRFMQIDGAAGDAIRKLQPIVERKLPSVLDAFYDYMRKFPLTAGFFQDDDRISFAKSKQIIHWNRISSADFNQDYVRSSRAIGEAHARVGLHQSLYIGGYAFVVRRLIEAVLAEQWPKARVFSKNHEAHMTSAHRIRERAHRRRVL